MRLYTMGFQNYQVLLYIFAFRTWALEQHLAELLNYEVVTIISSQINVSLLIFITAIL